MSEEEQEQRQIYKKILEYEQDAVSTTARDVLAVRFCPQWSEPETEPSGGLW